MVRVLSYAAEYDRELIRFWNAAFANRRNFRPLSVKEWSERVVVSPAFDPKGLVLAVAEDGQVVGGVHAMRPAPQEGVYRLYHERHHIAWLMVAEGWRNQGIGTRLLRAAENWLYYCPVHFATETTPLYGSVEGPRPPLFGSSQRMGVSLRTDRPLIDWLARRGYAVVQPGDVSLARDLSTAPPEPPEEPDWAALKLEPRAISQSQPWTGAGFDELRLWGDNGGWPYAGTVLVDEHNVVVGRVVWYPMAEQGDHGPSGRLRTRMALTSHEHGWGASSVSAPAAAIARLDVDAAWQSRGLGSYLLDRALHEMGQAGFGRVEVQTHVTKHPRAYEMYRRRGFTLEDAWASLVKT